MKKKNVTDDRFEILTPQDFESDDKPRKMKLSKRTSCVRCGTCCTGGSPVLIKDDFSLFTSGILSYDTAYTIREGEFIGSQGSADIYESPMEMVKIKEKEGTAECIFFKGEGGCAIYENRPAQCRAYKCWAQHEMITGLEEKCLTRKDLFGSVDILIEIMTKHHAKCSYGRLSDAFARIAKGEEAAVEEIMDALQYDTYMRPVLQERFSIPGGAIELLLGRSLIQTINAFGFKVVREGDDYILLPVEGQEEQ